MNSMFSSFDALRAEFLGQRVKSSIPTQQLKTNQEGNMESLPEAKKQSRRSPPRFAVELDGLNCFENYLPLEV
ncbi:hypothetical protein D8674_019667 [Pyrus ussuriensis x Pyrus communis]|uniref:Uncharacterized protein n=1 Tax=Pyrus ussuriensis x Pyrus communis TaxID=2448454 RepID=A0A5N5G871_9ROSA|nr:hypothetical protein D8674_019667 [Pyrus ussuriensis x Pyrus communis]